MAPSRCLLIRADASPQIGAGHVMRCLALAQAWCAGGGQAIFAIAEKVAAIDARLAAEKMTLCEIQAPTASEADARATMECATQNSASWIALDGYRFDQAYIAMLRNSGRHLLVLDDDGRHAGSAAELMLNQNAFASRTAYSQAGADTALLLGNRYTLLRSEFLRHRNEPRPTATTARRILVTFGAADPANTTSIVVAGLAAIDDPQLEVVVIVGAANANRSAVEAAVAAAGSRFQAVEHASDLSPWMTWADVAVAAAGSTCWEMAFLQVPQLVVPIAENQRPLAAVLAERGAAIDLGWHEDLSASAVTAAVAVIRRDVGRRESLARAGRALIDGRGASRVVLEMRSRLIALRPVEAADSRWIWELASDPGVRAASFSSQPIPWETHCAWFEQRLANAHGPFFIAADENGEPLGQVRFEVEKDEAVISASLVAAQRGRGHGAALILAACRRLFRESTLESVRAWIRPDNAASIRAFSQVGFQPAETMETSPAAPVCLMLHRRDLPEYAEF